MKLRFFLQSASYGKGVDMRLVSLGPSGEVTAEAMPATFKNIDEGQMWSEPLATLSRDTAQNLMDELWALGYRPEAGQLSVGQMAATEKHLQDMRQIVFHRMKIQKP